MYGWMDVWMDVCVYGCMYVRMYVCMYVHMHVYMYVGIYVYMLYMYICVDVPMYSTRMFPKPSKSIRRRARKDNQDSKNPKGTTGTPLAQLQISSHASYAQC